MTALRISAFALAALLVVGCSDIDPTTPADTRDALSPSFAKGGNKNSGGQPVLKEYWVIPGQDGSSDIVHVVVEGNVASVDAQLVYDYFHNGLVDDDPPDNEHFELTNQGPPAIPVQPLGNNLVHVDIPWDGRLTQDDPSDLAPTQLTIDIPGEGAPYVFRLYFRDAAGRTIGATSPRGIVFNGTETDPVTVEGTSSPGLHPVTTVRSYATFMGEPAEGTMFLGDLLLDFLQCEEVTNTSGKGKNRTVETTYRLSFHLAIDVERPLSEEEVAAGLTETDQHVWWEGHFSDPTDGTLSPRYAGPSAFEGDVNVTMPASWEGSGNIEFVVDFLSGVGLTRHIVYDPSQNIPTTTAGFNSNPWSSARTGFSDGMNVPVAHTSTYAACQ